jgi:hypothetical protein
MTRSVAGGSGMAANAAKPVHEMSGRVAGGSVSSRDRPVHPELMSRRKSGCGTHGLRGRN